MKTDLRLSVLGPMRAWRGEAQLDLGPVRQQAMLVALVLRPDVTVSQQELLDGVWGLRPPGTGRKVIPGYVHRLRSCLLEAEGGPVIGSDRGGYRFFSRGVAVDAARLGQSLTETATARDAGDLRGAVSVLSRALDLFQGEPLAGIPGPFAEGERQRLAERRMTLLQQKLDCQLNLGRYVESVGELSALMAQQPHSEPLAALFMRAFYGCGRQADALSVYTGLRHRLVEDLGVDPGAELRRVHQAVLRGDDQFLLGDPQRHTRVEPQRPVPAPRTRDHARSELPAGTGVLIGRARETEVLVTPGDPRVATATAVDGAAGIGKTALAVHAARQMAGRFPDGCLFVDLHGHSDRRTPLPPQRALRRLLRAVDEDHDSDDIDELAASWRVATAPLRLLVVLDDASRAEQVRPLLPTGAGSAVLVTSRQRLVGLDVDRRISLGPLDIDAATEMIVGIVGQGRADREAGAVRELAWLCDRLPLALRIAGARMQNRPTWTFESLVARLADDDRRLGELIAEDRSVEAAFRLSYDRLPDAGRHAFRALGLSRAVEFDPMTLAATLGWSGLDTERALESLVDASLLQEPVADRYRLPGLIAAYARRLAAQES